MYVLQTMCEETSHGMKEHFQKGIDRDVVAPGRAELDGDSDEIFAVLIG